MIRYPKINADQPQPYIYKYFSLNLIYTFSPRSGCGEFHFIDEEQLSDCAKLLFADK